MEQGAVLQKAGRQGGATAATAHEQRQRQRQRQQRQVPRFCEAHGHSRTAVGEMLQLPPVCDSAHAVLVSGQTVGHDGHGCGEIRVRAGWQHV